MWHFQSALFLWEMSLSFVEGELLSESSETACTGGTSMGTEGGNSGKKNKPMSTNILMAGECARIYMAQKLTTMEDINFEKI